MPRPLRIQYEGAWYHVMNRGTNHQTIYFNSKQKLIFLSLLEEISKKYCVEIHSYCLMDNHYHLLIRTLLPNLAMAMRHLDGVYTQKFNHEENRDGPLFRGRYKSILINAETHLLRVSRYIHLNPVAANICINPNDYKWSSSLSVVNNKPSSWLHTQFIFDLLQISNTGLTYEQYLSEGNDEEISKFYNSVQLASILGDKKFIQNKIEQVPFHLKKSSATDVKRIQKFLTIELIIKTVSVYFNLNIDRIINSKRGKKNIPRTIAIYLASEFGQIPHQQIATYFFNLSTVSVSNIICRFKLALKKDLSLKDHIENLQLLIKS